MNEKLIRPIAALFLLIALYDGGLGLAFFAAPARSSDWPTFRRPTISGTSSSQPCS